MSQIVEFFTNRRMLWLTLIALIIPTVIVATAIAQTQASDSVQTATANWSDSGHADFTSGAFNHWQDDDPPEIPVDCAACHSAHGMLDYLGERGTEAGSVSQAMPIGSVVSCVACHNDAAHERQTVSFPSGAVLDAWDVGETTCLICHQGTESTVSVNEAIGGLDDDAVNDDLSFINVHYHVAAATIMGTTAQGGYEYDGLTYVGRFEHTNGFQTCASCHDAHSLGIEPLQCSTCHNHVQTLDDLRDIRVDTADYDGDGDTRKGISLEIDAFHDRLYEAIRLYADEVIEAPIVYSSDHFPYFFNDVSAGGEVDPDTLNYGNRYTTWTPRLVRMAYNYHFVQKDPGAYAHNPRYVIQLMHDSLSDAGEAVLVDMSGLRRP